MFKDVITAVAAEEFVYRTLRVQRKGNAWWTDVWEKESIQKNTVKECGRGDNSAKENGV